MSYQRPRSGRPRRYSSYSASRRARARYRRRRLAALGVFLLVLIVAGGAAYALLRNGGGGEQNAGAHSGSGSQSNSPAPGTAASSHSPSASPSQSATTSAAASKTIEIGWIGDTTPGSQYGMPPDGGRALFASVANQLRQPDLMIANCEGTYSTATTSKGSGANTFSFQAPPSYAKALVWAGIDMVSIANNHSHDYLELGMQQTEEALKAAGVEYAGVPDQTPTVDIKGVKVAVLAFSPYPWNNNINDIPKAQKLVSEAAKEADLVVVLFHGGAEGADQIHTPHGTEFSYGENRGDLRAFSHAVIDSGADLVLGSGPHVIRGIERYKHRLVAYSLGNFAGWGNFGTGGNLSLSGLLTVKIKGDGTIVGGRWLSLYLVGEGVPTVDSNNTAANLVRQLSEGDFSSTYTLSSDGSFSGE